MAQRGRPIPAHIMLRIIRLRKHLSLRQTARECDTCQNTVIKYSRQNLTQKKKS